MCAANLDAASPVLRVDDKDTGRANDKVVYVRQRLQIGAIPTVVEVVEAAQRELRQVATDGAFAAAAGDVTASLTERLVGLALDLRADEGSLHRLNSLATASRHSTTPVRWLSTLETRGFIRRRTP